MKQYINTENYNYIMFVDASGDDGYKFKEHSSDGSSFSFVVSCFVTTPNELDYNKQILLDMKQALYIKPEQEIKSTALKRHRFASKAYEKMKELHGIAFSLIADKRLIKDAHPNTQLEFRELTILAQNDLSGITHTYPYFALNQSNILTATDRVLIVIDNMKKREVESIEKILANNFSKNYDLIFRDSKDKNFSLIQIADIMAGTIRTYYENSLPLKTHNHFCRMCVTSTNHYKGNITNLPSHILCCTKKHNKKHYKPYISNFNTNIVLSFHKREKDNELQFMIIPMEQFVNFMFIKCLITKTGLLQQ